MTPLGRLPSLLPAFSFRPGKTMWAFSRGSFHPSSFRFEKASQSAEGVRCMQLLEAQLERISSVLAHESSEAWPTVLDFFRFPAVFEFMVEGNT